MMRFLTIVLSSIFLTIICHGQQASSPVTTGAAVATEHRPIDPLFVKPVSQLTATEILSLQKKLSDWPQLSRYREDNLKLPPSDPGRIVFIGDSITDAWSLSDASDQFMAQHYVNRGISGQTTAQMLVRFQQDVVALHPAVVVILAGINDIAGNMGESTLPMIEDNFRSMIVLAQANHIRVVVSSVLPAIDFPWRPGLEPASKVRALNIWLRQFAAEHGCIYLDYYSALADSKGGMRAGLSRDNVHPTRAGYDIMLPLAKDAISRAMTHAAP